MKPVNFKNVFLLSLLITSSSAVAQSSYKIPDHLTPLSKWKNGYSADETMKFRRSYEGSALIEAGDIGAYASRRISEFLNTAVIHRDGPVAQLKSKPLSAISGVVATTDLGKMTLQDMMNDPRSRIRALAVVHKGKLVFEKYTGLRPWDNHAWASAAKSINGLLIHMLHKEGRLDLKATVGSYLPELADTAWGTIPVSEVLHQRSGLDIREGSLGEPGHPTTQFYATFSGGRSLPKDASFLDSIKSAKKLREPGKLFEYSSMNTYVLGMILQKVTGKPFSDLVTERIWSKAGMEGDALLGLSPTGEPSAFGVFSSRLRDLARYGMLFTPSWNVVASEPLVSKDYFSKVYAASKPDIFRGTNLGDRLVKGFGDIPMGASYQWDAVFADGDIYKSGRTGQGLYISPKTDTVVVWFSSAYKNTLWVHAYAREIVNQVFRSRLASKK